MPSSPRSTDNQSPSILQNRSQPSTPQRQSLRKAASSGSQSSTAIDPPRPAKEGHEWVWFPEGYWAEREIRQPADKPTTSLEGKTLRWRKTSAKSKGSFEDGRALSPKTTKEAGELRQTTLDFEKPVVKIPSSPYLSETAHVESLQNPGMLGPRASSVGRAPELRLPDGESPRPSTEEGDDLEDVPAIVVPAKSEPRRGMNALFASRRGLDVARFRTKEKAQTYTDSPGRSSLDEPPTGYFAQVPILAPMTPSPQESLETSSVKQEPSTSRWRLFGKSSWRKGTRSGTTSSTKSSAKEVPAPGGPVLAPLPRSMTGGSGLESAFPGGEAVRVCTPPMKEDTADSKPRGLFFDLAANPPIPSTSSSSTQDSIVKGTRSSKKNKKSSSGRQSSRIEEEDLLSPQHQNQQHQQQQEPHPHPGERRIFDFDAPHSPNSETCPAHPQSQARMSVCVVSGRESAPDLFSPRWSLFDGARADQRRGLVSRQEEEQQAERYEQDE